ncbi:hypothetical protein ILYODFUR_009628 [Ilyodon furcidens]|uniref:Uncharacterized protein n=1 Tax=Ilyodon furcidens TaxID=33524 RepID=A0ABV0SLM4_9TELE
MRKKKTKTDTFQLNLSLKCHHEGWRKVFTFIPLSRLANGSRQHKTFILSCIIHFLKRFDIIMMSNILSPFSSDFDFFTGDSGIDRALELPCKCSTLVIT